jgi:hypothetical protein
MSIFLSRRSEDDDLRGRLDELEAAHQALVREHESLKAETNENVDLLTVLGVDKWLREIIASAKTTGWLVVSSPRGIVFSRPEGAEHTYSVAVPLPEDPEKLRNLRMELRARIICFEQRLAS